MPPTAIRPNQQLMSCLTMNEQKHILDSATAWKILGKRWKGRAASSCEGEKEPPQPSPRAAKSLTDVDQDEDLSDVYRRYIEKMNTHISIQSVADKAAERWKTQPKRAQQPDHGANKPRRPSEDFLEFLNQHPGCSFRSRNSSLSDTEDVLPPPSLETRHLSL
eukprot:3935271-Rhodomonas_salina.2